MASDDAPDSGRSEAAQPRRPESDPETKIIRRHPTGAIPVADDATQVVDVDATELTEQAEPQTGYIPRARPAAVTPARRSAPNANGAIATAVVAILSGWATAVIATDLITAWWRSDRLFCVAIGFLTAISAAALITGLIGLLLRRRVSRLLVVVGAVVALLIFSSLFVAGAKLPPVVYAIPVLPLASIALAALPITGRWAQS